MTVRVSRRARRFLRRIQKSRTIPDLQIIANEIQTESTLLGIKMLMSVFPALFGIIGGFLVLFYPITDEKMLEIELDLKNKG